MTKREKIRNIYETLKSGILMCEMCETRNLNGDLIGYHQGLSFSCDGEYLYFSNAGSFRTKANLKRLAQELDDCNIDMIVTRREFEEKSGMKFFSWGI